MDSRFHLLALTFALVFALVNAPVASVAVASNKVARIGFINYMFATLNGQSYGDTVQVQEAMAGLAAAMFNDRRFDVIPALNLTGCNKNVSIEWTCSTGGSPRLAFSYVSELANLPNHPHAIVGPKTSREVSFASYYCPCVNCAANVLTKQGTSDVDGRLQLWLDTDRR
jgi:hypothetical protein